MSANTRPACYELPSARIVCLLWLKAQSPTGWQRMWRIISRAWRHG